MAYACDASKFDNGECAKLQKDSLKCLMDHNGRRDLCTQFFLNYRECTKERQERLAEEKRQETARRRQRG